MKKVLLVLLVGLVGASFVATAQERKTIKTEGATTLNEIVDTETQYLLPYFVDGSVLFKSGGVNRGKINYNILMEEIQFIDPATGNVMAVANQADINMVSFGRRTLINGPKGFIEPIYEKNDVALSIKRKVKKNSQSESIGIGRSNTASTEKLNSLSTSPAGRGQQTTMLNVAADEITVERSKEYFLIKKDRYYAPNKKGFTKVYSSKKAEVEAYIDEQKIDFKNENDLKKLIDYCNSL